MLNRGQQLLAGGMLQQEGAGPGAHRPHRQLGVVVHREHQHLALDAFLFQPDQHVETAQPGHRQIGDDQIRPQANGGVEQLLTVADRADDIEVVAFEQADEALFDNGVVIGDQNGVSAHNGVAVSRGDQVVA